MYVICGESTVYDLRMQYSMQCNSCFTLLNSIMLKTLTLVVLHNVRFIFLLLSLLFYYGNILEIKAYTNETCTILCGCCVIYHIRSSRICTPILMTSYITKRGRVPTQLKLHRKQKKKWKNAHITRQDVDGSKSAACNCKLIDGP